MRRASSTLQPYTHGFRSTFRDWAAETVIRSNVGVFMAHKLHRGRRRICSIYISTNNTGLGKAGSKWLNVFF